MFLLRRFNLPPGQKRGTAAGGGGRPGYLGGRGGVQGSQVVVQGVHGVPTTTPAPGADPAAAHAAVQGDHGGVERVVLHPRVAEVQRPVVVEIRVAGVDLEPQTQTQGF